MDVTEELYQIADELRGTANLGLQFADNDYDDERYSRVLALSARVIAAIERGNPEHVLRAYRDNLRHVSPGVGGNAAVFRGEQLLLIQRTDNGRWCLPGGGVDIGETWAQSAERELREEAGVLGRATRLLGVWDSRAVGSKVRSQVYHGVFLVECDEDRPVPGPEALDARYFSAKELPDMADGHDVMVPIVFDLHLGRLPARFD